MGADDDADCVEHVWELSEVVVDLKGARQISVCSRCGATSYEASAQD